MTRTYDASSPQHETPPSSAPSLRLSDQSLQKLIAGEEVSVPMEFPLGPDQVFVLSKYGMNLDVQTIKLHPMRPDSYVLSNKHGATYSHPYDRIMIRQKWYPDNHRRFYQVVTALDKKQQYHLLIWKEDPHDSYHLQSWIESSQKYTGPVEIVPQLGFRLVGRNANDQLYYVIDAQTGEPKGQGFSDSERLTIQEGTLWSNGRQIISLSEVTPVKPFELDMKQTYLPVSHRRFASLNGPQPTPYVTDDDVQRLVNGEVLQQPSSYHSSAFRNDRETMQESDILGQHGVYYDEKGPHPLKIVQKGHWYQLATKSGEPLEESTHSFIKIDQWKDYQQQRLYQFIWYQDGAVKRALRYDPEQQLFIPFPNDGFHELFLIPELGYHVFGNRGNSRWIIDGKTGEETQFHTTRAIEDAIYRRATQSFSLHALEAQLRNDPNFRGDTQLLELLHSTAPWPSYPLEPNLLKQREPQSTSSPVPGRFSWLKRWQNKK